MDLPTKIHITDVGPRDGLQNEKTVVSGDDKITLVNLLAKAGLRKIEVSSFVSPTWVPQLADADEVFKGIQRREGVTYSALVPNERGLDRALAAGADKIAVFAAASETFSRRNTNTTIAGSLERFQPVIDGAKSAGLPVRGYVSCVVACPYEGAVDPRDVLAVVSRLLELGVDEIDLGETIGVAVPSDIEALLEGLAGTLGPGEATLHLHDTRGTALACAYRALQLGVTRFDASCGGLGGCPYAPGAAGNLATEDLVYLCEGLGVATGVDLEALYAAGRHIAAALGRTLPGRAFRAEGAAT